MEEEKIPSAEKNDMNGEEKKKCCGRSHMGSWITVAAIAALVIVSVFGLYRSTKHYDGQNQINITGQASVMERATSATVTVGVQVDNRETTEEALNELNTTMAAVIQAVVDTGIPKEKIATLQYLTNPVYRYDDGEQTVTGYGAWQKVVVTIENSDTNLLEEMVETVTQQATQAGADSINDISYEFDDRDAARDLAVQDAIRDAREKAPAYAQAAGVRLKGVVGWYEVTPPGGPYPLAYAQEGGYGGDVEKPTLPSGDGEQKVEVVVTFKIKSGF